MNISNTRSDYIVLSTNIVDLSNIGTNLYIKTGIIDLSNNAKYDISWQNILRSVSTEINYKNRIILSGKIRTIASDDSTVNTPCCLITKNNIKNNMKFIYDSSINNNGKILFVKNLNSFDNSVNYLFDDLSNTLFENDIGKNLKNTFINTNNTSYNRYIYNLNYYFSDSDIYKINIKDFLHKYAITISNNNLLTSNRNDISYANIRYKITNVINDFSFINTTIDSSSSINFDVNDFSGLLIDNSTNTNFINDISINPLSRNTDYSIYRNIWSYNKLTLDYKHVNKYSFELVDASGLNNTFTSDSCNNTIKTFLVKTNNFGILQKLKSTSKIIFGSKNIYLNNIKVLDITSKLHEKPITISGQSITLRDASNLVFLKLGKQLTGITQRDIYRHVCFYNNSNNNLSIKFVKNINVTKITTNSKFTSLAENLDKHYLLDISLNYNNNTNSSHNINNTINFNNVLYNNVESSATKIMNLDFNSYFDVITNNYFKNSFNNLARINNKNNNIFSISNEQFFSISNEQVNAATYIQFKDLNFGNDIKILNRSFLEYELIGINSDNGYDFRYNYNKYFYGSNNLNLLLNYGSLNLTNKFFEYSDSDLGFGYKYSNKGYTILNFYSLRIGNLVTTTGASDFTNVDCIYIYHDPINDPDPQFRYPNNNIEIKRDGEIDTLSKAIEQYRGTGGRTSSTNAAFIPAQNGSNLSRKMIQGIIGLNNIPKLLSIKPYDPNFINGRGFINQYQITDECIDSSCDKIAVKQNAIKHDSVKNSRNSRIYASNSLKKQNYANIVKSNAQNKLSQECIAQRQSANPTPINVPCNNNTVVIKKTPFVLFTKGKGNYLGA
jgi:hypothetical protein